MHPCQRSDDLQMAQLFGADIHEQILHARIFGVYALDRILHRGSQFAVRAAKLLQQHVAETGVRLAHVDRVHKFLDVMIHLMISH